MKKLLTIAAFAITFASCTKEDTGTPKPTTPKFTAFGIYQINDTTSYMQIIGSNNSISPFTRTCRPCAAKPN